jgi:hypothetical protein
VYFPTSSVNPGDMFQYLVDNAGLSPLLWRYALEL